MQQEEAEHLPVGLRAPFLAQLGVTHVLNRVMRLHAHEQVAAEAQAPRGHQPGDGQGGRPVPLGMRIELGVVAAPRGQTDVKPDDGREAEGPDDVHDAEIPQPPGGQERRSHLDDDECERGQDEQEEGHGKRLLLSRL